MSTACSNVHAVSLTPLSPLFPPLFPRSDPEFLYQVLGEVIKAGATTLNIFDTIFLCT
jgi:isopropylmalate/homocitrate/citramalate synthase